MPTATALASESTCGSCSSSFTQSLMSSSLGGAAPAEPEPEPEPQLAEGAPQQGAGATAAGESERAAAAQTRQGAPALIRTMQNDKCRARAKSGPLMAIMTLLRPGGTAQGLGGGFRWGQRVLRACLHVRKSPGRFGAS